MSQSYNYNAGQGYGMGGGNFTSSQDQFPSMGQQFAGQAPQQQNQDQNPPMNAQSNPFTMSAASSKAFVPEGMVGYTEDYPNLGDTFGAVGKAGKKSKKGPTKEDLEAKKKAEMELLPTKGKPASFFQVFGQPQQEQMMFVFQYYPQYSYNPGDILQWCFHEANRLEQLENAAKQANNDAYGSRNGRGKAGAQNLNNDKPYQQQSQDQAEVDAEPDYLTQDSSFGAYGKKKGKNQQNQQQQEKQPKGKKQQAQQQQAGSDKTVATKTITRVIKEEVVTVDESELIKVDTGRDPCSLVFIGHVDAGKSTISGQIMLQMGMIDEREIEKYRKEAKDKGRDSWWLAYVMDVGDEEKAKGKTVEMGRAYFNTDHKQITVFDAPGHKNYVPNMIMGASMADFGGLVISARKGEYEAGFEKDGQTREHVQLARSLGIQKIIVVVNKMDDPSVKWSESRWLEIQNNLTPFLISSGFKKEDFQFVPISGLTGENLKDPVDKKQAPWYNGPTLIKALDDLKVEKRDALGPVRIPVLDKMKEQGMVAFGKIESGTINIGDKLMIMPSGNPTQVGGILDHKNEPVKYARPGENIQIKLTNLEEYMVNKGDVIVTRDMPVPVTILFEAEMDVLELIDYKPIMSKGYQAILHMHTIAMDCLVKDIVESTEKGPGGVVVQKAKPNFVRSYAKVVVRIQTKFPIALDKFDVLPQLGRFTLRDEGRTIAVGKVLKYKPHKVEPTIIVAGTKSKLAEESKTDKHDALLFDMETGKASQMKKQLNAIDEEGEDFP